MHCACSTIGFSLSWLTPFSSYRLLDYTMPGEFTVADWQLEEIC